jgi:hypothetical protein
MRHFFAIFCLLLATAPGFAQEQAPAVKEADEYVQIDTDVLQAKIRKKGYVSGISAGSLLDKKSGARDQGFGLSAARTSSRFG